MARILADLPDEDIKWLDALAFEQGKSRAQLLRDAVAAYRPNAGGGWIERGAGYWQDRPDITDGVEYQQTVRADRDD
ncbi:ribbon-helix-helix protein, CopG family [Parasphingorhabdus sp.]|uniref:ribbon-helix-helix protein, CopG family n=1 Tax=Parasphingorhabdus sp. TaxID=2709688 RepID=UPI003265C7F6